MEDASTPTIVHSWTIPTPRGLWHQALVFVDRGVFLTDRIDVTTLKRIQKASSNGTPDTVRVLTDHGRFKRPIFLPYGQIKAIRTNHTAGTVEIEGGDLACKASVPNRERLESLSTDIRASLAVFAKQSV